MQAELGKLLLEFGVFEESYSSGSTAAVAAMTRKICPHHVSHYIGEKSSFLVNSFFTKPFYSRT